MSFFTEIDFGEYNYVFMNLSEFIIQQQRMTRKVMEINLVKVVGTMNELNNLSH